MLFQGQHEVETNERSAAARLRRRLIDDQWLHTLTGFVVLSCVLVGARLFSDLAPGQIARPWLLGTALQANVLLVVGGVVALVAIAYFGSGALLVSWHDLERGRALRFFSIVLVTILTWRHVAGDFDFAYGQWWTLDRVGLVVLGAISVWKPVGLLGFIVQLRLLQAPIRTAFGLASGATLDDLPILALAAVAATVLLGAIVGERRTHVFVNLLAAATAAQFFISGRRKLGDGWLGANELANFPLNGFHQGWLGSGDGSFAETLSGLFSTFRWPLLIATLVLEVGAVIWLAHRRSLMAALVGWSGFHFFVFLGYGFSFLEWALVELGFVALLLGTAGARWSAPAFRVAPVAVTAVFVVFGGAVFKPPTLAWFDGPMTYAYEIDATDANGEERRLVANDFAPHDAVFAFGFLHLGPTPPLAAAYGALNRERFDDLEGVANWDDVIALEGTAPAPDGRREQVVAAIEQFMLSSGDEPSLFDRLPDAPTRYSTSREGQNYEQGTMLVTLSVTRVTMLRVDGEVLERREHVVDFELDDGSVVARWSSTSS